MPLDLLLKKEYNNLIRPKSLQKGIKMQKSVLKNKIYLYLTEFFSGMSVMAAELGASRLLAPYFSSSQIVWTIIIGTIMIAMALGNIYGGRAADKNPDPDRLYIRILIAAVWLAAIPVLGKYIIVGISAVMIFAVNTNLLIWAAFAACMIIFVFPLFLLGTVTPSLVKYTVDSLSHSGRTVGLLNASNTIGSIIGTFVPTFVTIPSVGTSATFLIFAGILLLLAGIYFISERKKLLQLAVALLLTVLCCIFGAKSSFAFWEDDIEYEGESVYNYLQITEDDDTVILSTNVLFGVQSMLEKSGGLTGMYYDYAMAAPYMAGVYEKDSLDVLILGMGTGTYATQCSRYFDNLTFEGVEIDEKIIALSREYFELPEEVSVTLYDGRAFLNASDKTYDIIMVDAYQDITIPFQMSTVEFFTLVREHLRDGGVMVMNMNMRTGGGGINDYLSDTVSAVFDEVYTIDVGNTTNVELFAACGEGLLTKMTQNVGQEQNTKLNALMTKILENLTRCSAGNKIMTDDKAPVELLGMKAIDTMIFDEAEYYKSIFKKYGFKGLIDSLS